MLDTLIIAFFTLLRIGIPAVVLLTIGEMVRRNNLKTGKLRGV